MPGKGSQRGAARRPEGVETGPGGSSAHRLLRYSHIFASAVHDILESKLLREVSRSPLTLSQLHLLAIMSLDGQHQAGEVAGFLGVSPPAATKNIDKLERLGLVVRAPSKGDRRATLLSVSPKGRRLVRKYEELKAARLSPVLERFRPAEIKQLSDLLERFSVSLLSLEPSGDRFCLRCAAYIEDGCPVGQIHGGCPYEGVSGTRPRERAPELAGGRS